MLAKISLYGSRVERIRRVFFEMRYAGAVLSLSSWAPTSWEITSVSSSMYRCSNQKCASQKQLGVGENWLRLSGRPRAPIRLDSMGVSSGKDRVSVREAICDG